jgi:hypothetical protein
MKSSQNIYKRLDSWDRGRRAVCFQVMRGVRFTQFKDYSSFLQPLYGDGCGGAESAETVPEHRIKEVFLPDLIGNITTFQ